MDIGKTSGYDLGTMMVVPRLGEHLDALPETNIAPANKVSESSLDTSIFRAMNVSFRDGIGCFFSTNSDVFRLGMTVQDSCCI